MAAWSAQDYYLMKVSIITGKPCIFDLAKVMGRCELEIYDRMNAIRKVMVQELTEPESQGDTMIQKVYRVERKEKQKSDRLRMPPDMFKREPKEIERPKAEYSNHSPFGIAS